MRQFGKCPLKSAQLWAKKSYFLSKIAPEPGRNAQTKGNGGYTTCAPRSHRVKEPSSALQVHDMSKKRPKQAPKNPKVCAICTNTPKPSTGRILGYVAQNPIPRAPSPPATTYFFWFSKLRNRPTSRLDPRTSGHLVEPKYSLAHARGGGGATLGPLWSAGRKKKMFFKVLSRPLAMLKQVPSNLYPSPQL